MAGSVVCGCVLVRTLYNERMAVMRSVKERVSCFFVSEANVCRECRRMNVSGTIVACVSK